METSRLAAQRPSGRLEDKVIKRVEWVAIWSENVEGLLPFYRDVLGLRVVQQWEGYVSLSGSDEGSNLNLGTHSEVRGKASDPYRHMVGLRCDDVDGEYVRLSSLGVEFIEKPAPYPGFRLATLKDPEGNLIQLYQPVQ
jgi:predicted enzyme related to lactoylglutathione lyase